MKNGFDDMFDLNNDGMLDPIERAFQMEFLDEMSREESDTWEADDLETALSV